MINKEDEFTPPLKLNKTKPSKNIPKTGILFNGKLYNKILVLAFGLLILLELKKEINIGINRVKVIND